MRRRWLALAGLLGCAVLWGCGGGGDGPVTAPVTGTVTYKGQPLAQGTITFYPASGRPAYGKIQNGRIVEVTTLTTNDGATVGPNKVTIQSVEGLEDMYKPAKWLIPERYGSLQQSGLTAEIKPGQTNELTFALTE